MARAQQFTTMGKTAQAAPSVNPGSVSFNVQPTPFVRAAQNDLDSLSRASAFFVRDVEKATDHFSHIDLRNQKRDTKEQETALGEKATVDATSGAEMDPEASQFAAYADAYKTIKGSNTGAAAFGRFLEEAGKQAPPDADPVAYARKWAEDNPFTIGDDTFDAKALLQFDAGVQKWALNERGQRVRAAQADGVMELNSRIGGRVQNTELTPEGLQTAYAEARALMPHDPANAAKVVISGLVGAARTPEQMQHVMATLSAPGSFSPGKSYAQQFPQAYADIEETFTRKRKEAQHWDVSATYDDLDVTIKSALDKAEKDGDWSEVPRILAEIDRADDMFGRPNRSLATRKKLVGAIEKAAVQTASFNLIALGAGDPDSRTKEAAAAWKKSGDVFMTARGLDPLSSAPVAGSSVPASVVAAQVVSAYGSLPPEAKTRLSNALVNGEAPDQQAAAFRFYRMLERSNGATFALSQMPAAARPLYQAAQSAVGDTGDAAAWFRNFGSQNMKEEDDIVTMQRITGTKTPAEARTAAEAAVTSAFNDHIKAGGWFQSNVTMGPDVMNALMDDLKVGAVVSLRTGATDLKGAAKAAAERVSLGVQVIPGRDGKLVATWSGTFPETTDDGAPRVPLSMEARNPRTGKVENTSATANGDLSTLADTLPSVAGKRSNLSLFVPPESTAMGKTYRSHGVLPVLNQDLPIIFRPGKEIGGGALTSTSTPDGIEVAGAKTPGVKLSADPREAQDQFDKAFPKMKGFALFPVQVPGAKPGEMAMTYQVVYRPRFQDQGMTLAEREAGATLRPADPERPAAPGPALRRGLELSRQPGTVEMAR